MASDPLKHLDKAGLKAMRDMLVCPDRSLPAFAKVKDIKDNGKPIPFDPSRITKRLQQDILAYTSHPPRHPTTGQTLFLALIAGRQSGKSTVTATSGLPHAMYKPGWEHVTIADDKDRAEYLHGRILFTHENWPEALRVNSKYTNEVRQLSLKNGSKMRTEHSKGFKGIGQSPDFWHASEVAFWPNAGKIFNLVLPSLNNRDNAFAVAECTPAPLWAPSAEWWRDFYFNGKLGQRDPDNRFISKFYPYWDSILNRRPWPKNSVMTNEEIRLLDRYGPLGMVKENLAFRRMILATDIEVSKNPALFDVFYPPNDIDCWASGQDSCISSVALDAVDSSTLEEPEGAYHEFKQPDPNAVYLLCVDPTGYGMKDSASFHIVEVWAEEWEVVASFHDHIEPHLFAEFALKKAEKYNKAYVAIERNGPGNAVISTFKSKRYPRILGEWRGKKHTPGIWCSSNDKWVSELEEALINRLVVRNAMLFRQMQSYRNDRETRLTERAKMLASAGAGTNDVLRRKKHHWDLVSALMVGVVAAPQLPTRYKRREEDEVPDNVVPFVNMTYDDIERWRKETAKAKKRTRRKRRGRRGRRRR